MSLENWCLVYCEGYKPSTEANLEEMSREVIKVFEDVGALQKGASVDVVPDKEVTGVTANMANSSEFLGDDACHFSVDKKNFLDPLEDLFEDAVSLDDVDLIDDEDFWDDSDLLDEDDDDEDEEGDDESEFPEWETVRPISMDLTMFAKRKKLKHLTGKTKTALVIEFTHFDRSDIFIGTDSKLTKKLKKRLKKLLGSKVEFSQQLG